MHEQAFHVWAAGDAHVGTDNHHGRASLAEAIEQAERDFPWDIMIDVGDLSGSQHPPDDAEGRMVVEQYGALKEHRREQVYNIVGNHDASGADEPTQWWFRKWVDPLGENAEHSGVDASKRPFAVEGTWDRYRFVAGNVLFLLMGDRNDGGPPVGRGAKGGYPAGAVTGETFDWWVDQVESNQDKIIVTAHHHMLKETTCGSGEWEGFEPEADARGFRKWHYHGYFPDGGPMGSGYLYWVDGNPDAQAFERYLAQHPGAIDLWIGGHTHTNPDDVLNGRGLIERKWGVTFCNCAAMSNHHGKLNVSQSRPMTFTHGSDMLRIRCYQHSDKYASQGWYDKAERTVTLRQRFEHPQP